MTQITPKTHPNLSPAERRAERARLEGAAYKIIHSEFRLTRKSDGKPGVIRFALVFSPGRETPYTVRLNRDGRPVRCSCDDWTRRADAAAAAGEGLATVEPCKHGLRVQMCAGQDQEPGEVVRTLPQAPFDLETEARMARALKDRELWD